MNGARPIVITGGLGLIGSALASHLRAAGRPVRGLTRGAPRTADDRSWDPGAPDPALFENTHAVVHLAGATLAKRWTAARRQAIRESRVEVTRRLVRSLARVASPPRVLVSASAVGIYGDRGDEILDERSEPGRGFLAGLARDWEAAAMSAEPLGLRVVRLRFGMVLDPRGGALARLVPITRLGLGGPLGSGRQWWSWIAIEDLVEIVQFAIADDALVGAVNAVAPAPASQREFSRSLGRAVGSPTGLPTPAFVLRMIYGAMADETLLASHRVLPRRLSDRGFRFRYAALDQALNDLLNPIRA